MKMFESPDAMKTIELSRYGLSQFPIVINGYLQIGYSLDDMNPIYDGKVRCGDPYDLSVYQTRDHTTMNEAAPIAVKDNLFNSSVINGFSYNIHQGPTDLGPHQDNNNILYPPQSENPFLLPKSQDFNFGNNSMGARMSSYLHPSNSLTSLGNLDFSSNLFPPSNYAKNDIPHSADYNIPSRNMEQCFPTLDVHHPFRFTSLATNENSQEDGKIKNMLGSIGNKVYPQPPLIDSNMNFMNKGYVKPPMYDFFNPKIPVMSHLDAAMSYRNLEATYNNNFIQPKKIDPSFYLTSSNNYNTKHYSQSLQPPFFEVDAVQKKEHHEVLSASLANELGAWQSMDWKMSNSEPIELQGNAQPGQTWLKEECKKYVCSPKKGRVDEKNEIISQTQFLKDSFQPKVQKLQEKQVCPFVPSIGHVLNRDSTSNNQVGDELENFNAKLCPKEYAEKLLNNVCGICDNWLRCGHEKCKQDYDKKHTMQKLTSIQNHLQAKKLSRSSKEIDLYDNVRRDVKYGNYHNRNFHQQRKKRTRDASIEINSELKCSIATVPCSSHGEARDLESDQVSKKCKVPLHVGLLDELSHPSLELERRNLDYGKAESLSGQNASQPSTLLCSETNILDDEAICQGDECITAFQWKSSLQERSKTNHSHGQASWESSFLDEYGTNRFEQLTVQSTECFNVSVTDRSKPKSSDSIEGASDYDEHMFEREEKAMTHFSELFKASSTVKKDFETNTNLFCHVCQNIGRHESFSDLQALVSHGHAVRARKLPEHRGYARAICEYMTLDHIGKSVDIAALITKTGIRKNHHRKIVWPPMIVIENARIRHVNKQWIGLSDQELTTMLLDLGYKGNGSFISIFGKHGHRGKVLLRFPPTREGWQDANQLHKQFSAHARGFLDWIRVRPVWKSLPKTEAGLKETLDLIRVDDQNQAKLVLYGYLAKPLTLEGLDPQKRIVYWRTEPLQKVIPDV